MTPPSTFLGTVVLLASLVLAGACSNDDTGGDSDDGSGDDRGGSGPASGGSAGSGTGGQGGTSAPGGTGGVGVDCGAVCNRVRTICEGQSTIDDNWVSVCTGACDARVRLSPDVALLEKQCVDAATTCTVAVLCVANPTGGGGSGGTSG